MNKCRSTTYTTSFIPAREPADSNGGGLWLLKSAELRTWKKKMLRHCDHEQYMTRFIPANYRESIGSNCKGLWILKSTRMKNHRDTTHMICFIRASESAESDSESNCKGLWILKSVDLRTRMRKSSRQHMI